jgi:hypothetical protein
MNFKLIFKIKKKKIMIILALSLLSTALAQLNITAPASVAEMF